MISSPPTPSPGSSSLSLLLRPVLPDEKSLPCNPASGQGAFPTDFGSQSTAMLGWERPWKRLGGLQITPVWSTQHRCLVLWLVSEDKTLLPALKSVKAAPVSPLLLFVGWGGQPCCHRRGASAAELWEQLPVPTTPSLAWPWPRCPTCPPRHQLQLLMPLPCDHDRVPLHGRDLLCRAGSRLQTSNTGRSKMHLGTLPGRAPGKRRGEQRAPEGMWGHSSMRGSVRAGRACITASQNAASAVRGSARERVDMATLCGGSACLARPCIPSTSPSYPASPGAPVVSPANMVTAGHSRARKLMGVGGVKCSQMKQNATRSRKITPTFTRKQGFQLPFG